MKLAEGKTALVTSASRGIGLACALRLAEQGAHVFPAVRRVEDTQTIFQEQGHPDWRITPVYFDATDESSYAAAVDAVLSQSDHIDILVNNFGMGRPQEDLDVVQGTESAFFDIVRLNLGSVYRMVKLTVPHMPEGGSIVNVSSIGGMIPDDSRTGYGVSKAAVNHLTRQIALQYASRGIRCNAVLPGLTATEAATRHMTKAFLDDFLAYVPLHRIGSPDEIANAVLFLASGVSSYITGHLLDVAGGYGLGVMKR